VSSRAQKRAHSTAAAYGWIMTRAGHISFTIDGRAVPWSRTDGGRTVARFTPARVREYQDHIKLVAREAMVGIPLMRGPCVMVIRIVVRLPTSWSKAKAIAVAAAGFACTKRPDWDNLGKIASDACNGIVFADDCQVFDGRVIKIYGDDPRMEIEVREVA
jgi:Holliday junction resolvase RusA-like endonuclease